MAIKAADLLERFYKLSGYTEADLSGYNAERRSFVTANGGKYTLSSSGKLLRKILGPDTPRQRDDAAEEE